MAHNVIHWGEVNALKFLKKLISLLMYNPGCSCHFPQCTFTYSIFPFLHPQLLHSISAFSDSWSSLFLLVQVIDFVFQSSNFKNVLPLYHSSYKSQGLSSSSFDIFKGLKSRFPPTMCTYCDPSFWPT